MRWNGKRQLRRRPPVFDPRGSEPPLREGRFAPPLRVGAGELDVARGARDTMRPPGCADAIRLSVERGVARSPLGRGVERSVFGRGVVRSVFGRGVPRSPLGLDCRAGTNILGRSPDEPSGALCTICWRVGAAGCGVTRRVPVDGRGVRVGDGSDRPRSFQAPLPRGARASRGVASGRGTIVRRPEVVGRVGSGVTRRPSRRPSPRSLSPRSSRRSLRQSSRRSSRRF